MTIHHDIHVTNSQTKRGTTTIARQTENAKKTSAGRCIIALKAPPTTQNNNNAQGAKTLAIDPTALGLSPLSASYGFVAPGIKGTSYTWVIPELWL